MTIDAKTLDDLERLNAAASGPIWSRTASGTCGPVGTVYAITPQFTDRGCMSGADTEFIVAMRRAAPDLIRAAREREEAIGLLLSLDIAIGYWLRGRSDAADGLLSTARTNAGLFLARVGDGGR